MESIEEALFNNSKRNTRILIVFLFLIIIGFVILTIKNYNMQTDYDSIAKKMQDTSYINYLKREIQSDELKEENKRLLGIIENNSSQKVILVNNNTQAKTKIKENENKVYDSSNVTDSDIRIFTERLDKIKGN